MSALPKPSNDFYSAPSTQSSYHSKSLSRKTKLEQRNKQTDIQSIPSKNTKTYSSKTSQFPQTKDLPANLRVLLLWQKSSLGLAIGLIATSIFVYVSTVRIPEIWSKKYEQLEILQRQERELTAANESLKHKLAQESQSQENNLSLVTSNNTIFIPSASLSQPKSNKSQTKTNLKNIPMGY